MTTRHDSPWRVTIHSQGEVELEDAFDYYTARHPTLGHEFLAEFRKAVDAIITHPTAWHPLDPVYRRYRLHRFPYGVVYRIDASTHQILVLAVMHLSRRPGYWKSRAD